MRFRELPEFDLMALGRRIREARKARRLSLDALSYKSEVSRSMIAAVESGQKAPTILVLHKIATSLDLSLARLLDAEPSSDAIPLPHASQAAVRGPLGWERRTLSPSLTGVDFEFARMSIPAGVAAGVVAGREPGSRAYIAVERGSLRLTLDGDAHDLAAGDALFFLGDRAHEFSNPGDEDCNFYLVFDA